MNPVVVFGEEGADPSPEFVRLTWNDYRWLENEKSRPAEVRLPLEEVSRHGPTVEKILALCRRLAVPVTWASREAAESEYGRVLGSLLGIPVPQEPSRDRSFPTTRNEEPFLSAAHYLLSLTYRYLGDPESLLLHLQRILSFYAEVLALAFSLRTPRGLEIYLGGGAGMDGNGWDYFLRFCKQDLVLQDRFVDLETLAPRFLKGGSPSTGSRRGSIPISSYLSLSLTDSQGGPVGVLHLASAKNHYFNERVLEKLHPLMPFFGQVVALSLRSQVLAERKAGLLALFTKFLPEPVIRGLLEERRDAGQDQGRKTRAVILFSDIRSFTTITEKNGAEPVVQFLNRHFQAMVSQISDQGGVVDKFIGDAIVAVFDADQDPSGACARAVKAARNMQAQVPGVDVSSVILDGGRYGIGIGLHMGEAVAGSIGSTEKAAFTVIGDVIERAEELEAETKHFGVGILMSARVAQAIADPELKLRDLSAPEMDPEAHVYTVES